MTGKMQLHRGTEYLQPPPGSPTLDAKKSPLALLAQTCSSIGKETRISGKLSSVSSIDDSKHQNLIRKTSLPSFSSVSRARTSSVSMSGKCEEQERSPLNICRSPVMKTQTNAVTQNSYEASPLQSDAFALSLKGLSDCKKRKITAPSPLENEKWKQSKLDSYYYGQPSLPNSSVTSPLSISSGASPPNGSVSCNSKFSPPPRKRMSFCDPCCGGRRQSPKNLNTFDVLKSTQLPYFAPAAAYPWYAQMLVAASRDAKLNPDSSPHVCHWVSAGTGNCGRRFSTSEELLVHLQTHALASGDPERVGLIMNNLQKFSAPYAAYLSHRAAAIAAVPPSSTVGEATLSKSRSPAERYPFKGNMLSQLPNLPSLPIAAGVGPFYSPYAFYGQRLGAAGFNYL